MSIKPLTSIDLFAGIGGFALASRWLGIETTQFVEINPFCRKILAKNFPDIPCHDDVRSYHPPKGSADLIVGGSPCQDLSVAGKQKGIIEGARSSLWFEQLRIIQECDPTFVIWENVFGAVNTKALQIVLEGLCDAGYRFDVEVVSGENVGSPHQRKRIFVVAYSDSFKQATRGKVQPSWAEQIRSHTERARAFGCWEGSELPDHGVDHGVPDRMAGNSALGNAVIPQCAAVALMRVQYLNTLLGAN